MSALRYGSTCLLASQSEHSSVKISSTRASFLIRSLCQSLDRVSNNSERLKPTKKPAILRCASLHVSRTSYSAEGCYLEFAKLKFINIMHQSNIQ
ncbi:hypothetical protein Y032_0118g732 [Ancylostoma ceylanicum]|uniref:Uncharacterized protein n=1 Tax=Ancylostoma ceylanicum TaxID=53326 RepID=A0A016TBK1_9BILA|nr:hypothetical protein Y032_0118g732 [Ancylostoma ceylanicum]